jgi:hypothetical protein
MCTTTQQTNLELEEDSHGLYNQHYVSNQSRLYLKQPWLMAQNRPPKRQRVGGAYHDPVPFTDNFSLIHAREGKLLRVGNELLTAPAERSQHDDQTWNSASSWLPADDPQFALDPDGEWYDEVVDAGVMEDNFPLNGPASTTQRKKRVRSKVSVGLRSFRANIGI